MTNIHLTDEQRLLVTSILRRHFPECKYFIFGSRSTGHNLKPFSDLDLAVASSTEISAHLMGVALEDFSSSNLPFKVDLIDLNSISSDFRNKISADLQSI